MIENVIQPLAMSAVSLFIRSKAMEGFPRVEI